LVLNYIWIAFFVIAFVVALAKLIFLGDVSVFPALMSSTFDNAKLGFELSLGLTGIMTLWLGIMKIGEKGGAINYLSRAISPFFNKLFPDIPKNHPVHGSIVMNLAANMLGLDNAATPLGLKAMAELQELNTKKDTASNPMIMFLVLNASGLTIIPISIMVYRAQLHAADPSDIFIPILISTFASTLIGIIAVSIFQKINMFCKEILLYLGSITLFISGVIYGCTLLSVSKLSTVSSVASNLIIFSVIIIFILLALRKKINIYDSFIEGAKGGFKVAIKIVPFLIAILVAVGVFKASGAMTYVTDGMKWLFGLTGMDTAWVDAFPVALMKPLSGSGARGLMVDTMNTFGVDSFAGRLACTFQGAADTTFYIIAVYFGSVGIKNSRYAVTAGLLADLAGVITAIFVAYLFFG